MPDSIVSQSAVIPYRLLNGEGIDVALITNRTGERWIIPKGMIDPGECGPTSAARECREEAGLVGEVDAERLGVFRYMKFGAVCEVEVFAMRVTLELAKWDEDHFRRRAWFAAEKAALMVSQPEVAAMIRDLAARVEA